jgi:hypothetical protein
VTDLGGMTSKDHFIWDVADSLFHVTEFELSEIHSTNFNERAVSDAWAGAARDKCMRQHN